MPIVSLCSIARVRGGAGVRARRVGVYPTRVEHLAVHRRSAHHVLCHHDMVVLYCSEREEDKGKGGTKQVKKK
jgi:hypothetical protein